MPYKLEPDEPVQSAVRRCAKEQLDRALSELTEKVSTDPAEAIHSARKAIKKERSLLRLVRGSMPGDQRARENATLRDVARGLSGARDADVMISSIDELSERFAGQLPATTFRAIRTHLEDGRRAAPSGRGGETDAVEELTAIRARVPEWHLGSGGWTAIESGLLRSYRRGRAAFRRARASGATEELHEWRKRVKDLWYHERLLAPACGPAVRGHAKDLDRLSDLLGDDHDLAVLEHELTVDGSSVAVDLEAVRGVIDHRRAELQTEATRIGERVYAETPKAYRRRLRTSWKAGRALARTPEEQHPAELAAATR